jgi:hypothetical protein
MPTVPERISYAWFHPNGRAVRSGRKNIRSSRLSRVRSAPSTPARSSRVPFPHGPETDVRDR